MIEPVAKILKIFHNNSLFDEDVKLIGSWCFHLYQKRLGVKLLMKVIRNNMCGNTAETSDEKMNNSMVVY